MRVSACEMGETVSHESAPPGGAAWQCVRLITCLLLVTAASAKLLSPRHGTSTGSPLAGSADAVLIALEAFVGCWLAFGAFAFGAWVAAVSMFWCFFIVSAYQSINGSASCGCFGDFQVNPVYTALVDAAVLLGLCRFSPAQPARTKDRVWSRVAVCACAAVAVATFFSATMGAMARFSGFAARPADDAASSSDPHQWVGEPLPFIDRLSTADRICASKCLLIFVRPECAKCQDVIAASRDRGGHCVVDGARLPIVLVQVTIDPGAPPLRPDVAVVADTLRIANRESWPLPVPSGFLLDQGRVLRFLDTQSVGRTFSLAR